MRKNKLIVGLLLVSSFISLTLVKTVRAVVPTVSITNLPSYINNNTFKLSYSALPADPSTYAQFYIQKEGGSYVAFGSVINAASSQIEVTGAQVNDQVDYCFKVEINSGAASDETCTTYDISGPSPAQNYWKEKLSSGSYRLHWKNPWDTDFSRVLIYRGTEPGFTADGSHKVGEVGGLYDTEVSWDNFGLDSSYEYYYALRAIDNAGNSASLVGDTQTVFINPTVTPTPEKVSQDKTPSTEEVKEEVLQAITETTPTPTLRPETPQNTLGKAKEDSNNGNQPLVIAVITCLALAFGIAYLYLKKNH